MIYQRVRNHFPSRRFFLRSTAFVSISLASIVGIQSITQWSESPQAIASETYPGCDVPDRDWQSGDFEFTVLPGGIHENTSAKAVTFSPSETYLASGHTDGRIYLWGLNTLNSGRIVREDNSSNLQYDSASPYYRRFDRTPNIRALAFSQDEHFLVSGHSDGIISFWNISGGTLELLDRYSEHTQERNSELAVSGMDLTFSRDGLLVTGSDDKFIRVWTIEDDRMMLVREIRTAQVIRGIDISPDGKHIASAGLERIIEIWELETGRLVRTLGPYLKPINSVAFHPCIDNTIAFSPDSTSNPEEEILLETTNTVGLWNFDGRQLASFEGHQKDIETLSFSPSGRVLITGSMDQTVKIWDTESVQEISQTQLSSNRGVIASSFGSSGRRIVVGLQEAGIQVAGLN
ncbi:MAG: WD40 repeat domain-containing protein [Elainellaceae cyanobacterium]